MADPAPSPRVDLGRVVVVVLFVMTLLSASGRAWVTLRAGGPARQVVLEVAGCVVTVAFCVLVVGAYLRRGTASATDRSASIWLAAPAATALPLVIPALPVHGGGGVREVSALVLVLAGTVWSVWSVRHLSTCLSVVPQARGLVASGPYRLVRHPLYLGELVSVTGFAVRGGTWAHAAVVLALLALQLYRARHEEALLIGRVPGYADYAARTAAILPTRLPPADPISGAGWGARLAGRVCACRPALRRPRLLPAIDPRPRPELPE